MSEAVLVLDMTRDSIAPEARAVEKRRAILPQAVAYLAWARGKGMRHTARVVAESAIGELQSVRILRDSAVKDIGSMFHHRRDAWEWLTIDR